LQVVAVAVQGMAQVVVQVVYSNQPMFLFLTLHRSALPWGPGELQLFHLAVQSTQPVIVEIILLYQRIQEAVPSQQLQQSAVEVAKREELVPKVEDQAAVHSTVQLEQLRQVKVIQEELAVLDQLIQPRIGGLVAAAALALLVETVQLAAEATAVLVQFG
jgi:hypothetical protein